MNKKKSQNTDIPAWKLFSSGFKIRWKGYGATIRYLRDFAFMDQADFGRLIGGYTRGKISRYEAEKSEPPIDFWVKVMKTFGLNINWAMTGDGIPYISAYADCPERKRFLKWYKLKRDMDDFAKAMVDVAQ